MAKPPLDYGFKDLVSVSELAVQIPRKSVPSSEGKYDAAAIKLNNNKLSTVFGMTDVLPRIILQPEALSWVDLSFNKLTCIEPVLTQLHNLQILYLHGNCISDFPHLEILNRMLILKTLTLHGNPVDRTVGYRYIVISWLRRLKNLDFSVVTELDRMQSELWGRKWFVMKTKL